MFRTLFVLAILTTFFAVGRSALSQGGAKISGTALIDGENAKAGLPITLYSEDDARSTVTDSNGHFEFDDVPPGNYDLHPEYFGIEGAIYDVQVASNDVGPLTLATKSNPLKVISDCGRNFWVKYNPGGSDVGGVYGHVELYPTVSSPNSVFERVRIDLVPATRSGRRISRHADADGNFVFRSLPPGGYRFAAYDHGYWKIVSPIWDMRNESTKIEIILHKRRSMFICE